MAKFNIVILLCAVIALGDFSALGNAKALGFQRSCPSGWSNHDSHCYIYISAPKTWSQAEKNCLSLGGNLVSIHSAGENDFVTDLVFKATGFNPGTWIGGSDFYENMVWFWSDGTKFDYSNWASGEPNNSGREQCVHTHFGVLRGFWNNFTCQSSLSSVCKLKNN